MIKKANLLLIVLTAILLTSCFGIFEYDEKDYARLYIILENNTTNLECMGDTTDVYITVTNPKADTAKSVTVLVPDQARKYLNIQAKYGEEISVKVTAANDSTKVLDSKKLIVKYIQGWNDPPSPRIGYCNGKGITTEFLE